MKTVSACFRIVRNVFGKASSDSTTKKGATVKGIHHTLLNLIHNMPGLEGETLIFLCEIEKQFVCIDGATLPTVC